MAEDAQRQTPKHQTDQALAPAAAENWEHNADTNSVTESPFAGKPSSPLPHAHNINANLKAESGFVSPTMSPDAASLVSKVMQGITSGSLRFVLLGDADGGVDIWRASQKADAFDAHDGQNNGCKPPPAQESLLVDVKEARNLLGGISRTSLWRLVQQGCVTKVRTGVKRTLFSRKQIDQYVKKQAEAAAKSSWSP